MNLTWYPIDNDGAKAGPPYVIAAAFPRRGAGSKVVLSSSIQHSRSAEQVLYPRAESAEQFERGNASTTFAARVIYEFSSYQECLKFCNGLGNAISGRGNLHISHELGGADVLPRAVWQRVPIGSPVGQVVIVEFTFIGGAMNS